MSKAFIPVIRDAGGRTTEDVLRTFRVLSAVAGNGKNTLGAVAVIHHTDCGANVFDDEFIKGKLKERVEGDEKLVKEVEGLEFRTFGE
jgi:carbonic anhydrase